MFDFKTAESAAEISFLKPGVYAMKVSEVKLDKFLKGATYLGITFETADGLKVTEKMGYNLKDPKAKQNEIFMSRLQYLHEAWSGKKLDKVFKKAEEIEAYFAKCFVNAKAGTRKVVIGGSDNGKAVFAELPFTNFIVGSDSDLEEGEFEVGSTEWKKYVKASSNPATSGKKQGILNAVDDEEPAESGKDDEAGEDDTPW